MFYFLIAISGYWFFFCKTTQDVYIFIPDSASDVFYVVFFVIAGIMGLFRFITVCQKIKNSAEAGQPLSGEILVEMERAFGADFSRVTIHTDAEAVRLNRQLRSRAFTRGQDVFHNELSLR